VSLFYQIRTYFQNRYGLGKTEKLFSGERIFRFASANLFSVFCPRGGGVWGGIRAGFLDFLAAGLTQNFP
jgi:hypothetical protein